MAFLATAKPPRVDTWEPSSFFYLESVNRVHPARRTTLRIEDNTQVLETISSHLFAGKLIPISNADLPWAGTHYRNMWPVKRSSRRLPYSPVIGANGKRIPIYMTEHSSHHSRLIGPAFAERGIERMPHYSFWGFEDLDRSTNVINYGAGYIAKEDKGAVNDHLIPLMRALRGLAKSTA